MPVIPYCGAPPPPGAVAWNLDPVLLGLLLAAGLALALRRAGWPAFAGWGLLLVILVSPLCNLSVALFSARVAQHLLLIFLAAPLLASAFDLGRNGSGGLVLPTLVFAGVLWMWHLPGPYLLTFASPIAYWAMQASLFGAALWLWAAVRDAAFVRPEAALMAVLATAAQMAPLGALLTLSPRPFFLAAHSPAITGAWGLTPLEDQQIGGLLMWVPGGLLLVAACVVGLAWALRQRVAA